MRHRRSICRSSISGDVAEMRGTQIHGDIDLLVGPLSLVRAVGSLIVVLSLLRVYGSYQRCPIERDGTEAYHHRTIP
jgi:hypothetical protein